jgi:hypothetical protein
MKSNGLSQSWSIPLDYIGQDIAFDSNNCIYVVGYDYSYNNSIKLMKYNSSGVQLWNKELEGLSYFNPMIKIDLNNNLYLAGYCKNQTTNWNVTIFKFNSSGDLQWQKIYEQDNIESINDIAVDSEDHIYIYGSLKSDNLFIMKYNKSGSQLWFHEFGEIGICDYGSNILIDSDKNIIISGSSYNDSSIYWLRSYNISRELQWSITREFESFPLLGLDSSDNVISIAWDYENYDRQLDLVKYDNSGNSIWNYTFESRLLDLLWQPVPTPMKYQFDLTLDSSDNIYIGWDIEIPNDLYNTDILIIKISNSGNFESYLTWGDSNNDQLIKIGIDSNENIYLLSDHYLIKNPVSNGKSLYRTNVWNFYLILFGICCLFSLISLYFIIRSRIRKSSIK